MMGRCCLALISIFGTSSVAIAQEDSASEGRDRVAMERFLAVVEKGPRRGTALDRVYGYHVERGTLDAFVKTYADRVAVRPEDGAAWMVLGLVESRRGRDSAAVSAFLKAEATRPDDALPAYYLGQSLVLIGRPDDAALAFERAIARKPGRADLMEMFQALGRVYQRSRKADQALAVWSRLEALFPDDPRVGEPIAAAMADEGQPEQALPRYERLAKSTTDRFRQVQFQIEAADLKVRLNRSTEALLDYEGLLGRLDPESWLHREVRRKVEEIFHRVDDQSGLASYYEKWVGKHPDDVEAMARLGRVLANQGRTAEGRSWFEKAVKLAPSRRDLRPALIEQLLIERKYAEAASQYETIVKSDPSNPDAIRDWGRVLLRDPDRPEAVRKLAAASVWRKLVDARPDDPATLVQVAELHRNAEMADEALALYRKAVAIAPESPQYAEYLGEFLHKVGRKDEARAAWSRIASPPRRTARSLARLAEVLARFGDKAEALAASAEAAGLDRDDFDVQLRHADLLRDSDQLDDERAQLDHARRAATGEEQAEAVLDRQIANFRGSGRLAQEAEALRMALEAGTDATPARWRRLARYGEAQGRTTEAIASARKALEIEPASVATWTLIARLDESTGDLASAADSLRKLADVDRKARTEHLTGVARLEARLGRRDLALKAGRDLLASAPGQVDHHQFFAELCFGLGRVEEGLDALRRAVKLNEADPRPMLALAETLAQQFRADEAIEMFWRAFDKSPDVDAKLAIVARLTALHLQRNQFDALIARLDRMGREPDRRREASLCLAQAYSASGDFGSARSELERLLATNPRNTKLLFQLAMLAEQEGDASAAARFQRQLVDLAPGDEATARLAQLHLAAGETAEAEAIWAGLAASGDPESARVLMAVDGLLANGKYDTVLGITAKLVRKQSGSWEAIYREGVALAGLDRSAEAEARFRSILAVRGDDDTEGAVCRARKRNANRPGDSSAASASTMFSYYATARSFPLQDRLNKTFRIRTACGLEAQSSNGTWSPDDLGQARMAAVGWLFAMASRLGTQDALVASLRDACLKAPDDPRPHWNLYYLQAIRQDFPETFEAAIGLAGADPSSVPAQFALLNATPYRDDTNGQSMYATAGAGGQDSIPALPSDRVDRLLSAFGLVRSRQPGWMHSAILTAVADELKRAGRDGESFYREAVAMASDVASVAAALRLAAERGDVAMVQALFDKHERLLGNKPSGNFAPYVFAGGYFTPASNPSDSIARAMLARADDRAHGDVLALLDGYLAADRRPDRASRRARAIASASASPMSPRFQVWTSRTPRFFTLSYPTANPYFDLPALQVLRNAYDLFRRDDLLSDLTGHLRHQARSASDAERTQAFLALASIAWWRDEKDESVRELTRAVEASHSDPELLLALAELREQRGEPEAALKVADSFEPLDQRSTRRRELLALRLAASTGDVDRARKAAERLFGLRLDSATQVKLAAQMHQLNLHELAEAVLGRARRRAGGDSTALVALMTQYQRQGQVDVAVQVAHQLLRRGAAKAAGGFRSEADSARDEALQVLARSGRLPDLIARAEAQVARTPGSVAIRRMLIDYLKAGGAKDRLRLEYASAVAIRPDDARLRLQYAAELIGSGDAAPAVEQYRAAIRIEPAAFASVFYEVEQAFRRAGKSGDFLGLIEGTDLRTVGPMFYTARVVQQAIRDKGQRARGLALFRRLWLAFPGQRRNIFYYVNDDEVWRHPEMYDYLREAVVPGEGKATVGVWQGFDETIGTTLEGRSTCLGGRLLECAGRRGKLGELIDDLTRSTTRLPSWRGGQALRAVALARRGRVDEAQGLLTTLTEPKGGPTIPPIPSDLIAQELEDFPALRPIAIALYESAIRRRDDGSTDLFNTSPHRRLAALHFRLGRGEDARRVLLEFARKVSYTRLDASVASYYQILDRSMIADRLVEFGYSAEGARMIHDLLADTDGLARAMAYFGADDRAAKMRRSLDRALRQIDAESLRATLKAQLNDPAAESSDLTLVVHPREVDRATVSGLIVEAIRSASGDPAWSAEVRASLASRAQARPKDVAAGVALAMAALASGPPEEAAAAVRALGKLVEASPLEPIEAGERANARQRAEAMGCLGLWLVARECARRPELREAGRALADRAIEAAGRQVDPTWALAMLRELGQDAVDRGDRDGAEGYWSRMLATISGPSKAGSGSIATIARFERAAGLATMAARNGLISLSIRGVVEPLRGGPPVVPMAPPSSNSWPRNPSDPTDDQVVAIAVESRLAELVAAWESAGVPPLDQYEALRNVVLPEGRPGEVFAYARPIDSARPRSVSRLLVRSAIRAGRVDELRPRLENRLSRPMAEAGARAILAQVDLATGDRAALARDLAALAARLGVDKLRTTAELAAMAVIPALEDRTSGEVAGPMAEQAASTLATAGADEAAIAVQVALARHRFATGRADQGRAALRAGLESTERRASAAKLWALNNVATATYPARRQGFAIVAAEFARAGQWADAMEALGQYVDAGPGPGVDPGPGIAAVAIARHLAGLPARERFDTLAAWTLPASGRPTLRSLVAFAPVEAPPRSFGRFVDFAAAGGVASTLGWLIDAAKEAGALNELADRVESASVKKVEGADAARLMVAIARGRADEAEKPLRLMLDDWTRRAVEPIEPPPSFGVAPVREIPWLDYLQARAAMADPGLADLGRSLATKLDARPGLDANLRDHLRRDVAASLAAGRVGADPGLALWRTSGGGSADSDRAGAVPGWWVAHLGHLDRRAGSASATDRLVSTVPLAGRFEVSVDAIGDGAEVGFGGMVMVPLGGNASDSDLLTANRTIPPGRMSRPGSGDPPIPRPIGARVSAPGSTNRLTIRVEPGLVRYLVNGHRFFEDRDPSPADPWLVLGASGPDRVDFRNFTLTGSPEIPREIPLVAGNRLVGWSAEFFAEAVPSPSDLPLGASPSADRSDWSSRDGVILGRRQPGAGDSIAPSRLAYLRPIGPGESISYEFRHEPDVAIVHPSIGRLALLLEPGGVRTRWITAGTDPDGTGLSADNAVDEPSCRRGPAPLPLKAGEWNRARVSIVGRSVELELNGVKVFDRELESGNDRIFGFYRDKARHAASVRDVVLRGAWPSALPADWSARREAAPDPVAARARHLVIGDALIGEDAGRVLREARGLPASGRCDALAAWVLPGDDRTGYRLTGDFSGGILDAPALALVAAAVESGRLDELADRVARGPAGTDRDRRGRLALVAIVATARGKDDEAKAALGAMAGLLSSVAPDAPESERWPELIVVAGVLKRPGPLESARPLARSLASEPPAEGLGGVGPTWRRHALRIATIANLPGKVVDQFSAWTPYSLADAKARGEGAPPMLWTERDDGTLTHARGRDRDFLAYRVPIRGDFEVRAEIRGPRLIQFSYGGVAVGLSADGKEVIVGEVGRAPSRSTLEPPMILGDGPRQARLSVEEGMMTVRLDGRILHQRGLPARPDPWLALYQPAEEMGSVRDVAISGRPTVPDRVDLSGGPDLVGWSEDGRPTAWDRRGDEIVGLRSRETAGASVESVLRYHRPMVEDGEMVFEFYHEGVSPTVHPSLGRLAFLIGEGGVRIHRLTDSPHDRTGLAPDNVTEGHPGPPIALEAGAWNRVALEIVGDRARVKVNGVVVCDRPIGPEDDRAFGLFRYLDGPEARVRAVVHRGAWPRSLMDPGFANTAK